MTRIASRPVTDEPEPAWEIATLFPPQGSWGESDYLEATRNTNRLVELTDGTVEVLAMPKSSHQRIAQYLEHLLLAFLSARGLGEVLDAPLRVRLWPGTFREPDLAVMLAQHADRAGEDFWDRADVVIEIVSPDPKSHQRDWGEKIRDYARAGIPEYWIVDPQPKRILVLRLEGSEYVAHSEAGATGQVHSALLEGFIVAAAEVWAAAKS